MKTSLLLAVTLLSVVTHSISAPIAPAPSKYFIGPVCRDVNSALGKGAAQHRPVWIVAWDSVFFNTPDGRRTDRTDYALKWFYDNIEVKKMVADNFIQVFTTLNNPAIAEWVKPGDKTHLPVYIVLDVDGKLVATNTIFQNPKYAVKEVQEVLAKVTAPKSE